MCSQWPPGSACPQSAQAMRAVLFANATATNGGLISYGVDLADQYRQAASYVRLGRKRLRRLLQIGRVELAQIPRDALLELPPAPLHFSARKVAVDC
jgi:hypothetical protein